MNSVSVMRFDSALQRGDDASALSLLETGRVTIDSVRSYESNGVRLSCALITIAVRYVREKVVLALVQLGARIDSFRILVHGGSLSPAGDSIFEGNVPALSLCLRLGADLSCVYRASADSPPRIYTGLEFAIREAQHAPLICLLDEVYTTRPVCLGQGEVAALLSVATLGSRAKVCYEALASRGFNFKGLEETEWNFDRMELEVQLSPSDESSGAMSVADALLSFARKSRAPDVLRYLMRDLGLVSTAGRMEGLNDALDRKYGLRGDGASLPRVGLKKYKCAACNFVGATSFCSLCKVPRYCSAACQRSHWKTGGHKKECKNILRGVHWKEGAEEGSSSAGPSKS